VSGFIINAQHAPGRRRAKNRARWSDAPLSITAMIANFTKPEKLLFTKRNLENF
jgi:hypothetical protein